jgi:hypothetical protein
MEEQEAANLPISWRLRRCCSELETNCNSIIQVCDFEFLLTSIVML